MSDDHYTDGTERETMAVVTERGTPVAVFESGDEAEEWALDNGLGDACLIYPSVRKRDTGTDQTDRDKCGK